jgi:cellulose synthase/poly-beta-1,6-N-acetylglucosamine synthase-like glycosyltransferase
MQSLLIIAELSVRTLTCVLRSLLSPGSINQRHNPSVDLGGGSRSINNQCISVIIPCFNEETTIVDCVTSAAIDDSVVEVLVCGGGSTDATLLKIEQMHCPKARVIPGGTSRATCQNIGASEAKGQILLFLHADSTLPLAFGEAVTTALKRT